MRVLKSGEVRYKASARKEEERLLGRVRPLSVHSTGATLQVFMGYGWATGYVRHSDHDRCILMLAKEQRLVCCTDNRNLRKAPEKER